MKKITWEFLESNAPDLIQNILNGLKQHKENPKYHPEGNAYEHIKTVVKRLESTGDVNLILAALFHDLGKLSVAQQSDEGDFNTSFGHENVSSQWVMRYKDWIEELGGNPYIVDDIVKNHMKIKFDSFSKKERERLERQTDPSDGETIFQKLNKFMSADNMKQDFNINETKLKENFTPQYYHLYDLTTGNYMYSGRNSKSLDDLKKSFLSYISGDYQTEPYEDWELDDNERGYKNWLSLVSTDIIPLVDIWDMEIHVTDKPIYDDEEYPNEVFPEKYGILAQKPNGEQYIISNDDSDLINEARLKLPLKKTFRDFRNELCKIIYDKLPMTYDINCNTYGSSITVKNVFGTQENLVVIELYRQGLNEKPKTIIDTYRDGETIEYRSVYSFDEFINSELDR